MEVLVLDTNIVSYLMNGHTFALGYQSHLVGKRCLISFMTVAELYEGAFRRAWNEARMLRLEDVLSKYLVVPYSQELAVEWGRIRHKRKRQPIAVADAWIAATALLHDCGLVTHNPGDFQGIDALKIITEYKSA